MLFLLLAGLDPDQVEETYNYSELVQNSALDIIIRIINDHNIRHKGMFIAILESWPNQIWKRCAGTVTQVCKGDQRVNINTSVKTSEFHSWSRSTLQADSAKNLPHVRVSCSWNVELFALVPLSGRSGGLNSSETQTSLFFMVWITTLFKKKIYF